jgi:hypothetical protein
LEAFLCRNEVRGGIIHKRQPTQNAIKFSAFSIAGLYDLGRGPGQAFRHEFDGTLTPKM